MKVLAFDVAEIAKPLPECGFPKFVRDLAVVQSGQRDAFVLRLENGKIIGRFSGLNDRRKGLKALHTLSAYATTARLVLAQTCVPEKTNEITAIPDLLDELAETGQGALATIRRCRPSIVFETVSHVPGGRAPR